MEQLIYSPKALGIAIKRQRKAKKLNQKEAGHLFKLEQSTISSIENGASGTRLETLLRLLAALDLEMVIRPKQKIVEKQDLYIYMNGIHVGLLQHKIGGRLVFTYDSDWSTVDNARPISLSMPLTETPYKGNIVSSFFDNLLPDSEIIRKRIQARFKIPTNNCFDFLTSIGADCIGALQILTEPNLKDIKSINASPINATKIATLLKNYQSAPLGMDKELDFRISIAGPT